MWKKKVYFYEYKYTPAVNKLTMGCCSSTVLSKSPCSQNSAATDKATWKTYKHGYALLLNNTKIIILLICDAAY